jgi:protein-tyrosine phosphatase
MHDHHRIFPALPAPHCVGGLGRTGVIAGCLLRALGVASAEALKRLVDARGSDCPQTEKQRLFVTDFTLHP